MALENIIQEDISAEKKQDHVNDILQYLSLQRNRLKKGISTAIVTLSAATLIATTAPCIVNGQESKPATDKPAPTEVTIPQKDAPPRFLGTIYAEGSYFSWKDFNEHPAAVNAMLGYNILKRKPQEGVLLFPNLRLNVKGNKPEFHWDNRTDIGIGAAYTKGPFLIGVEGAYRESFKKQGEDGGFARLYGSFWNKFVAKNLSKSNQFPLRPELIQYAELEASTLTENITIDGRLEGYLDVFNWKGFKAGPYIAGKVNYDAKNEDWNRYGQISGGIKITKGPVGVFLEVGHRESFRNRGLEGNYYGASVGIWVPISIK